WFSCLNDSNLRYSHQPRWALSFGHGNLPATGWKLDAGSWEQEADMTRYLIRRLLLTIPVLLGVATLVFALIHLVPGDPAQAMLGEAAPQADVLKLRHALGLDQPLLTQYRTYLTGLVRGDLGTSFRYNAPVTAQIRDKFPNTATLAVAAMLFAILFAIPLGILAAVFRGTAIDHVAMTIALAGISMPNFWLGPLLAILFAVRLGWLPVSGT